MFVKRIAACTIYLQPFTSYSEILHLTPHWGVPIGILGKSLVLRKLDSRNYQAVKTV